MIATMRSLCEAAVRNFKSVHAHMKWWTNEQVLEAMFLAASREPDSRIRVVGQDEDRRLRFRINLRQADGSDASRKVTSLGVLQEGETADF